MVGPSASREVVCSSVTVTQRFSQLLALLRSRSLALGRSIQGSFSRAAVQVQFKTRLTLTEKLPRALTDLGTRTSKHGGSCTRSTELRIFQLFPHFLNVPNNHGQEGFAQRHRVAVRADIPPTRGGPRLLWAVSPTASSCDPRLLRVPTGENTSRTCSPAHSWETPSCRSKPPSLTRRRLE